MASITNRPKANLPAAIRAEKRYKRYSRFSAAASGFLAGSGLMPTKETALYATAIAAIGVYDAVMRGRQQRIIERLERLIRD